MNTSNSPFSLKELLAIIATAGLLLWLVIPNPFIHADAPAESLPNKLDRYDAPDDDNHAFGIYSYGADEKPGGLGLDADISN